MSNSKLCKRLIFYLAKAKLPRALKYLSCLNFMMNYGVLNYVLFNLNQII